jgi:pyridoxal phosphate enzyme (YggS family)
MGLATVRSRIDGACRRAGRDPDGVILVAVTKTFPIEVVGLARAQGIEHFGENRAIDLAEKAAAVPATWHYLGKLQTGTANRVADHADVLHSAEPGRALERLAGRVARAGRTIDALAEVDFTGGIHQGVPPEGLEGFLAAASSLLGIRMVGLMTLPPAPPTPDPEASRGYFARLRELRDRLAGPWPALRELSMGMSADYEVAVEEGATMVRVGTALFGPRRTAGPDGTPGQPGH